jgi:hypothetical protein
MFWFVVVFSILTYRIGSIDMSHRSSVLRIDHRVRRRNRFVAVHWSTITVLHANRITRCLRSRTYWYFVHQANAITDASYIGEKCFFVVQILILLPLWFTVDLMYLSSALLYLSVSRISNAQRQNKTKARSVNGMKNHRRWWKWVKVLFLPNILRYFVISGSPGHPGPGRSACLPHVQSASAYATAHINLIVLYVKTICISSSYIECGHESATTATNVKCYDEYRWDML